ncbi:precorrin-6A reductase [Cohnella boryungensis]|uniref:Precorrin-6A reductase n=1 Tax=Cohnella boryungensis TaxID=768479 RepID=A0ABV8SCQ9_9BACL
MILVMAGTSDARELALRIQGAGHPLLTTVVTESAARSMEEAGLPVRTGRLPKEALVELMRQHGVKLLVDATHPFAEEASRNAIAAAEEAATPYIRYERDRLSFADTPLITYVDDYEQAAELAAQRKGVVMLTTGSKTLSVFAKRLLNEPDTTLVARMLPRKDNMEKCEELGLEQKNIVAMQGPFSRELNEALYRHYKVTLMITKESGKVGAVDEKLESALALGIETIIIGRPSVAYGIYYNEFEGLVAKIDDMLGRA